MNFADIKIKLQNVLDQAVDSGEECGCQLAIFLNGQCQLEIFSGYTDETRSKKVDAQTLFPVFSVGKGICATAVHQAVEANLLDYNLKISEVWPEFGCCGKADIRLWQILTHRSGLSRLPAGISDCDDALGDWNFMCKKMAAATPSTLPGTLCEYQGITFAWLIGETMRRATGILFKEFISRNILTPLQLENNLFFGTDSISDSRLAAIDCSNLPEKNSWHRNFINNPNIRHNFVPSANGVATAGALAKHYSALIDSVDGVRLLNDKTLDNALILRRWENDPIPPEGTWAKFGLGYALCGPAPRFDRLFGHGGAAGAEGFADRQTHMAIAFTKNKITVSHPNHNTRNKISAILNLPIRIW